MRCRVWGGGGVGAAGFACVQAGADFDLATADLLGDQFAQARFELAQLFGQTKREVEEAAVDRADFEAEAGRGLAAVGVGQRRAVLHAGVPGHTVNWHGLVPLGLRPLREGNAVTVRDGRPVARRPETPNYLKLP